MVSHPPAYKVLLLALCGLLLIGAGCLTGGDGSENENPTEDAAGDDAEEDIFERWRSEDPPARYSYERQTREGNVTAVEIGLVHGVSSDAEPFEVDPGTVRLDVLLVAEDDLHAALYPPGCEPIVEVVEPPDCARGAQTADGVSYWSHPDPAPGAWTVDLWSTDPSLEPIEWILHTGHLSLEE